MERDDETGLYAMGARYYAAWLGRWTSADPLGIGADGPGIYNYVRGSPIVLTDPGGMQGGAVDQALEAFSGGLQKVGAFMRAAEESGALAEAMAQNEAKRTVERFTANHGPLSTVEPGSMGNPTPLFSAGDISEILSEEAILEARDYEAVSDRGNPLWEQDAEGNWGRTNYIKLPIGTSDVEVMLATAGAASAAGAGLRLAAAEYRAIRGLGVVDDAFAAEIGAELGAIEKGLAVGPVDDALIAVGDDAVAGANAAADSTVHLFHGSVSNYSAILRAGLDPAKTPTWVTTSRPAAESAIGPGRVLSPGEGLDRGIIESVVQKADIERLIQSGGISPTRTWPGFGGGQAFPENVLRNTEAVELFNSGIVR